MTKKHHQDIHTGDPSTAISIAVMHRPKQQHIQASICPGCGYPMHPGGSRQCLAYSQACLSCHKVGHFAKVCCSIKDIQPPPSNVHQKVPLQAGVQPIDKQPKPGTNALHVYSHHNQPQLYKMQEGVTEPEPTIRVGVSSITGKHFIDVLSDSGTDVSAAGQEILSAMGHHMDNILPSNITPKIGQGELYGICPAVFAAMPGETNFTQQRQVLIWPNPCRIPAIP